MTVRFMHLDRDSLGNVKPRHTTTTAHLPRPDFLTVFGARPLAASEVPSDWERLQPLMPPGRWVPHRLADGRLIGVEAE